ncbi:hypothetical protein D3C78_1683970 [compost metagenome]
MAESTPAILDIVLPKTKSNMAGGAEEYLTTGLRSLRLVSSAYTSGVSAVGEALASLTQLSKPSCDVAMALKRMPEKPAPL